MLASADSSNIEVQPPATDWTPEQQIAHMLDLCEAQIEAALSEADMAVDSLIKSFTGLAQTADAANALVEQAPTNGAAEQLRQQVNNVSQQMASAIVAFQFYDKLTQRLGHVRYSLTTLAMFVCDRSQASEREQWRKLFSSLRRLYRTQEERQIFQLMCEGMSADDARSIAQQTTQSLRRSGVGEIELF